MEKKNNKPIGLKIPKSDIMQVIFTHELFTGSRFSLPRGKQYSSAMTVETYRCSNWESCQFQLKVRYYDFDAQNAYFVILHPHVHTAQRQGKNLVSFVASKFFKNKGAEFDIPEAKLEFEALVTVASAQADVLGALHRSLFPEVVLARVTGYVFEELLPNDSLLRARQRYYKSQNKLLNVVSEQQSEQVSLSEISM
ncbi:hypothetical protein SS50377_26691 [Spironucleus salmonicida]|uniref:Uncharacterized protein n=1 Tax=Spironucleus salmonicida TaxID=348837 RepID=V6LX97_9EUKA|nr:hypothetical protein SS50377_26691 [Spironucleus salmonicida]|eukprot:EST49165.1 hypothetical protein SS50377_10378 [Spironucleus salmonicida]